ncbi:cardiolipin synthase [Cohnella lubricantis]|uniref:Cardiolipin synthase n=1 Tax=Cohnella lubricantis TaxID=2163172 RepID=A0A841T6A8_9BACL|nr:cardiolipin synthase [Cohnella lubricantis]MBB6676864.1 cardiolipin synthase [Cohnella lubricantis]MBP2119444.1 cardiolipin synthase [Cohnella lubricantis]
MLWIALILLIFVFQAATILLLEHRRPAHAVAWLLILFAVPIVGFALYYFLAREYRRRRRARRGGSTDARIRSELLRRSRLIEGPDTMGNPEFAEQEKLFRLLRKSGAAPVTGCNRTKVLTNADAAYAEMMEAIRGARHHIHFASYIIRDDETGQAFSEALIAKARQGVQVRLIYDGIGSYRLRSSYYRPLQAAGVQVACFFPLRPSFMNKRMNYRNHRKILVADGFKGFVGGINVGDEYLGKHPRLGFWRDTHLLIEGDAVYGLQEVFLKDWELATGGKRPCSQVLDHWLPEHQCTGCERVQIVAGGPDRKADTIHETLFAAISAGKRRIWLTTPYFIPSPAVAMALRTAALAGLDVRLIIPMIPDTHFVHAATLSYMEDMMSAGVRVWQYERGFIHAKVLIVDDLLASVGTANLDLRSFFSNFETNAFLFHPETIARLEQDFLQDMAYSREMNLTIFRSRPRSRKLGESLARMLAPLL